MGSSAISQFTPDATNLTVAYSGNPYDWTYRRMILHYANLCTVAGGVNLFVIGSELRGLEILRGPNWTPVGTTDASGNAIWDYPFVAALQTLSDDVRTTFNNLGYSRNLAGCKTSSSTRPTGRAGWAGSIQVKTANGRISTSFGRIRISISSRSTTICR